MYRGICPYWTLLYYDRIRINNDHFGGDKLCVFKKKKKKLKDTCFLFQLEISPFTRASFFETVSLGK